MIENITPDPVVTSLLNEQHEYVILTTIEGHQQLVKVLPSDLDELDKTFAEHGQGAYITLHDQNTKEAFRFPGNIAVVRSFSQNRFDSLNAEREEKQKQNSARVIVPSRR